eukprot:Gb_33729 [translate_table: standard]
MMSHSFIRRHHGFEDTWFGSAYTRFGEVKNECASVLSEAAVMTYNPQRDLTIKNHLSFNSGHWRQDEGSAPLIPFPIITNYSLEQPASIHGASFTIEDVDFGSGEDTKMANVTAYLCLFISTNASSAIAVNGNRSAPLEIERGSYFRLGIHFQGIYTESNKGERVLCMWDSSRNEYDSLYWFGRHSSPWRHLWRYLVKDGKFLLRLHYPARYSLMTNARVMRGQLRSLRAPSSSRYLDEIHISSKLDLRSLQYEFSSEAPVANACPDTYTISKKQPQKDLEAYKGQFQNDCELIRSLLVGWAVEGVPNWLCNGADEYCNRIGPFLDLGGFNNSRISVDDWRCVDFNVSAVFRLEVPSEKQSMIAERPNLGNLTMVAEGTWRRSSPGQICMVACVGTTRACDFRVSIDVRRLSLSINQRSVVLGTISSLQNSFYPLSFEHLLQPGMPLNPNMTYKYSRIHFAKSVLERSGSAKLKDQMKKLLFNYPWKKFGRLRESFFVLCPDLSLHSMHVSDPRLGKGTIDLYIIAIEEFVGMNLSEGLKYGSRDVFKESSDPSLGEEKRLLKIAAHIKLEGLFSRAWKLSVEGLYDPRVGRMYLIGCLDVRAQRRFFHNNDQDLENGRDCRVEMVLEYPPTNGRLFIKPTVKVSITSNRTKNDRLFFPPMSFRTLPILYYGQTPEIISRKSLEGMLSILTLTMLIASILSQLAYIRRYRDATPYISLVMLGVQAVGYSIHLITGTETLFAGSKLDTNDSVIKEGIGQHTVGYMIKVLLLISFLLTIRLGQKIWKSRVRLLIQRPLERWTVPSDKLVFVFCVCMYATGLMIVSNIYIIARGNQTIWPPKWAGSVDGFKIYAGVIQDLFLLPQLVVSLHWQVEGKPLRKLYYVGITVLNVLPHVYAYSWSSPISKPTFKNEDDFPNPRLGYLSRFGHIAISGIALLLALMVYLQQRRNIKRLSPNERSENRTRTSHD